MTTTLPTWRVRFCEWQTFAINLQAPTEESAIALAEAIRTANGTFGFEELDAGSDDWIAELDDEQPAEPASNDSKALIAMLDELLAEDDGPLTADAFQHPAVARARRLLKTIRGRS